ncbi:MAG: ATP-binding protein [Bacillota bacterium]|nr:ATP-binding protein [Bacillota bacterium]
MLIQFSAENYLSLKEKIILSMLASNDTEHSEHLIHSQKKESYLKTAVIYGANASGKSNVLNAFWFMVNYVLTSHEKQLHKPIERIPFKFDKSTLKKPSNFEVIFTVNNIRYAYGFSVTDNEVVEEYLYYYPNGRQAIIFERKNTNEYRFTIDVEEQMALQERTSANKLYLSVASNWNYKKVVPVFEWFASCTILTKNSVANTYGLDAEQLRDDEYRSAIISMLRVADFGIQSLQVKDTENIGRLEKTGKEYTNIDTIHLVQDENGKTQPFALNMTEESDGTNSYFKLAGIIKNVLDTGGLLVADEMDAHLHPLLTKHLVMLFHSQTYNQNGAQLIFTSHNTNLLDLDVFRRDQIWFTEKDEKSVATDLFSLYDFSVRKDAKIEKGYLIGRYGAIPFIKEGFL